MGRGDVGDVVAARTGDTRPTDAWTEAPNKILALLGCNVRHGASTRQRVSSEIPCSVSKSQIHQTSRIMIERRSVAWQVAPVAKLAQRNPARSNRSVASTLELDRLNALVAASSQLILQVEPVGL